MSRLRPRTARQIGQYPAVPVVYRRRVVGGFFTFMLLAPLGFITWMLASPPSLPTDRLLATDWWWPLAAFVLFSVPYLIYTPALVVDATHVRVRNPFRAIDIPLGHVTKVLPGSTFSVVTSYGQFYAWGIEAANIQVAAGAYGTQGDVAGLIEQASKTVGNATDPPARYRFSSPRVFFWTVGLCYLACAGYMVYAL